MLSVTNEAMQICKATVRQLSLGAGSKLLRLRDGDDGVAITFELPRSDDNIVHHNAYAVLAVPDEIVGDLSDKTLDIKDDGRFVLC